MEEGLSAGVSKKATLVICVITHFLLASMISAVPVALPTIGKELAMEAVLLGWVSNAINLAQVAVLLPAGRLADIYGRKKIFIYGMVLFTVATFLCAIANSPVSLISYRLIQGIAAGMAIGTGVAIITSVFPVPERGRALGMVMGAVYVGMSVGPYLGGVLTQHLGWRSIFFMGTFLCLVVVGLTFWKLKGEWAEARGEKFDLIGSIALGLSLLVMLYGLTELLTMQGIGLFILGLLGSLAFVWWEARIDSPILNLVLFRKNAVFIFSNLAVMVNYVATFSVTFLLSLYLQYNKGFSPQTAGLILITQPVIMAIFAPISGRLSDRVEPKRVAAIGMAVNCVALSLFVFLNETTALGYIIAGLAIFGFGVGIFTSPNANVVMSSVATKFMGVASGTHGTMRSCGVALGMAIVMIFFSVYIGEAEITPEYYPAFLTSLKMSFVICAALNFGGIFAQLAGGRVRRN
jgi:EmrB/QacA subfamily drug resistance transporter